MNTLSNQLLEFFQGLFPGLKRHTSKKDIVIDCSVICPESGILFEYENKARPFTSFNIEDLRLITLSEDRHLWLNELLRKEQLTVEDVEKSFSQVMPGATEILALKIEFGIPPGVFCLPTRSIRMIVRIDRKLYDDNYVFAGLQ